jgi:PAS domain S-box-containing protein
MKIQYRVIVLALAFALVAWVGAAVVDQLLLHEGTFLKLLIGTVPRQVYARLFASCSMLLFGAIIARFIAQRDEARARAEHLNAVLRAIRNVNQLISHVRDRQSLIRGACQRLAAARSYLDCWMVLFDEQGRPDLVAQHGLDAVWPALEERLRRDELPGCAREALGKPGLVAMEDAVASRDGLPAPKAPGRAAALSVCLIDEGKVYGLLTVSAPKPVAQDPEEASLLAEVARDIGFALRSIDLEQERQRGEQALRESEARYRTLFEAFTDGIFLETPDGRLLDCNATACAMYGYTREEMLQRSVVDLVPDEVAARLPEIAAQEAAKGTLLVQIAAKRRDGSVFPVEVSTRRVRLHEREIVIAHVHDITNRKRAEKVLQESEERFRKIFEESPLGMVLASVGNMRIVQANPAICRMSGYTLEELARLTVRDITHPDDRGDEAETMGELLAGTVQSLRTEKRCITKEGAVLWISQTSALMRDPGGAPLYGLGIIEDITARKESEARLALLNTAVEQAAEVVIVTEPTSEAVVEYVNPAFERILGYSRQEVLGRPIHAFTGGEGDGREARRAIGRAQAAGRVWRGSFPFRRKDGTMCEFEASISPVLDDRGQPAHAVSILNDVTEKHALEQRYLQAQKMEAVGRLAGGVAHDFNNLLTVINGYSQLVMTGLEATDPLRKDVEQIRQAGERATNLTRQLLAFSRRQVPEMRVLNLNGVLEGMGKMRRRIIGEDVALELKLAPDLGHVKADPGQVEQVVVNLAVNARDAMLQGGVLTLSTANAELDQEFAATHPGIVPGAYVMFAITDTGHGMTPEVKAHLFEPFFTTKKEGEGTGLGLATVYGIVKQSGGSIYVYSEPGLGTTFKIYLPRVDERLAGQATDLSTGLAGGSETILVVEDQEEVRQLATRMLRRLGYQVLQAANAGEAMALVAGGGQHVDMMLTDVVMPEMSGSALAERLCQVDRSLQVLYMSGYPGDMVVRHAMSEPGFTLIQKPFTIQMLAKRVRAVLDGRTKP